MTRIFRLTAEQLREITFFKMGLPLIALIGGAIFLAYGFKGIKKRKTIWLFRNQRFDNTNSQYLSRSIEGRGAVVLGYVYILTGLFLLYFLGGTCFYMYFSE